MYTSMTTALEKLLFVESSGITYCLPLNSVEFDNFERVTCGYMSRTLGLHLVGDQRNYSALDKQSIARYRNLGSAMKIAMRSALNE